MFNKSKISAFKTRVISQTVEEKKKTDEIMISYQPTLIVIE